MKKRYSPRSGAARRVPQRTCVACRQVRDKAKLVRMVRTPGGDIEIDATGKKEGRGAYLCPARDCMEKALQGKQLEHVLRGQLDPAGRERLLINIREILKETGG